MATPQVITEQFRAQARFPWGDFPDVLRNGNLGELREQPEYVAAKAGDSAAALDLADRLVRPTFVEDLRRFEAMHERLVLLPVLAEERSGSNKIPLMFADVLANKLGWGVETDIAQVVRAWHTDAGSDHRLVVHSQFDGNIDRSVGYVLIDDTLTMGGTIADLRGYIMSRGGTVVGAAVAVAHEGAVHLPIRKRMVHWSLHAMSSVSESSASPKERPATSEKPYRLTPSEVDSLRLEMRSASEWARAELARRYPERTVVKK